MKFRRQLTAHVRDFFRNMPLKVFVVLVVFTICFYSLTVSVFSGNNRSIPPTEIDGFLPFAIVHNDQGKINFSASEVSIEATSASEPRVTTYVSSANFKWNFSAIPLLAEGYSNPIIFIINWNFGNLSVSANTTHGWFINYNATEQNDSTEILFGSALMLKSRYNVEIECEKSSETVSTSIIISNSSWQKELMLEFASPPNVHVECANLIVGASANRSAHSIAIYDSSRFVSYNSSEFTQQTASDLYCLFAGSIFFSVIVILVFYEKFREFPLVFSLFWRKLGNLVSSLNIKESMKKPVSYIKCNRHFFLLLLFFGGLRLLLAAVSSGHLFDTYAMKVWLNIIQSRGTFAVYPFSDILPPYLLIRPVYPYPPVIAYILSTIHVLPTQQYLSSILLKLPGIVADLLLGVVVFFTFKNREGFMAAIPALFLVLLNFVNSSIWGQYDSIVALFMVLSIWLVATKRIELGWVFAALAVCTKQTALILLPALLILSIKQRCWSRLIYGAIMFSAVSFIVWYPFLQNGFSLNFAMGASGLRLWSPGGGLDPVSPEGGGGTSIWAFNIWPLVTLFLNGQLLSNGIIGVVKDSSPNQFLFLSYFQLGAIIFALAYVYLSNKIWKASDPRDVMLQFGLLMFAFYMFPTRIHERYLIFAISFLPFAYNKSRLIVKSYLVLLTTYGLSLGYALVAGLPQQNLTNAPLVTRVFVECGLIVLVSINIVIFLLLFFRFSNNISLRKNQSPSVVGG